MVGSAEEDYGKAEWGIIEKARYGNGGIDKILQGRIAADRSVELLRSVDEQSTAYIGYGFGVSGFCFYLLHSAGSVFMR